MTKVVVTMGLQFGSEGKGQISGMIADQWAPDTVVCANHPNAGHTYNDPQGRKFVHRILPVGAAAPGVKNVLIGPGAVVDFDVLIEELTNLAALGVWGNKHLIVHPNAAVVTQEHRDLENVLVRIGSTMKGSAEAVIQKMRRDPDKNNTFEQVVYELPSEKFGALLNLSGVGAEDPDLYDEIIDSSDKILVEGAQGFSLGIHERFYPYGTSRDVSTYQVLADCRIPHGLPTFVQGVARTFPIRVANRFDKEGNQIGTSGSCYPDQKEIQWADLGREPELTTVTKLPRRVFTFSEQQIREAARVNGVDKISLTFADYLHPAESDRLAERIWVKTGRTTITKSFGPAYSDVLKWAGVFKGIALGKGPIFKDAIEEHFGG